MKRKSFGSIFILLVLLMPTMPVQAAVRAQPHAATPSVCTADRAFELPSHALGLVCVPADGWNGDVVVYAHGYVDPTKTDRMFDDFQVGGSGISLSTLVQQFGYAFAATTYRHNGLVVQEAVGDVGELIVAVPGKVSKRPNHIFLLGISEGSLMATLFAERQPLASDGVLAACGPIGDFKAQIDYFGDFRSLFDHYFPDVLPADAVTIPADLITQWDSVYVPKITKAIQDHPSEAASLIQDSGAAIDSTDSSSILATTLGLLRYNAFSTNDAKERLGGNPYDSAALRARFPGYNLTSYTADAAALAALEAYQTTGRAAVPLITAHTTGDEIIPVRQQELYAEKAKTNGFVSSRTFPHYGHCSFQGTELLSAFTSIAQQGAQLRRVFVPLV